MTVDVKNKEISRIFYEIADYLEMEKVPFKPYAYQQAAAVLETLPESVEEIYREGGVKALEEIPGVGKSIAEKIEEYLKTGKIKYYQEFKKKLPLDLEEITGVEGVGPQKAKILYQKLGIRNLKDLEKAAKSRKISPLFGFGEKTEQNILEGIAFLKKSKGRFLLGDILSKVKEISEKLERLKEVEQISAAGSIRRKKETIGDVDILITTKDSASAKDSADKIMDFFVRLPGIVKIWMKGPSKSSIRMAEGFDVDLRVVKKKSYGSALQYFTGSKEHNIVVRRIAIEKGLKLSEYGLFRGKKMIAGWSESGIYKALGLAWIEPELRENQGEIEAAIRQAQGKANKLPKIIGYQDIKGDLHCHSDWDGGENTIEEMAQAAVGMGYQYLGISDHTKFLRIENGLDEKELERRNKEIDKLNQKYGNFRILKSAETNILNDGSIDIKDEALKKLDYVIAGVHSSFKIEKEKMTERIIRAMKNPHIDVLSHPTGRILKKRDEYQIDFDKILRAAKEYGVVLEINSYPERLDLNDRNIRRAKEAGVKMVINTDSHHKDQLNLMEFGIAQARRGWAEKEDIANAWPLDKMLKYFK
ncbi:MAG TPA: DNA polymerase/3'-5' exonuclease PolX [Patescibacteria group bacterium]|nr:DNA polymerase/3'-5' exonuclease PolX [Patescibacteria group bacterium]